MKFKELSNMPAQEVKKMFLELQEKAHDLSVKLRLNQLKNTHQLKVVKKDIARILTFLHKEVLANKNK